MQSQERRNAENLSEAVSEWALQCFLTDARWDDARVICRLQAYLGPKMQHPEAVWVLDGSDFPKRGLKSVGVTRQYCGILGKIGTARRAVSGTCAAAGAGPGGQASVLAQSLGSGARSRSAGWPCSAQWVRATSRRQPESEVWVLCRQNLNGSEPRYYLFNASAETPLETLAGVGGSRWHIETEFEIGKSDEGKDEYETRTWPGWHHHITMCLLASAFLLGLQQAWGKNRITRPQVYRLVREILPRPWFGPHELLIWLQDIPGAQPTGQALASEMPRCSFSTVRSPTLKRLCNTSVLDMITDILKECLKPLNRKA